MAAKAAKTPSVVDINNANFTTSAEADNQNEELRRSLGLSGRNMAARLAIARSLSNPSPPPVVADGERGRTIKGANLFSEDLRVWLAFILEHGETEDVTPEDFQDLVARHWARGLALLTKDWEAAGEDFDKFILTLASQAGVKAEGGAEVRLPGAANGSFRPTARAVVLPIGDASLETTTQQRVEWKLNAPGGPPHIALLGSAGTGKTRTATSMLRSIRSQTGGVPVILFDMAKGDLAGDPKLVEALGATVVDPLRAPIPLDVLHATAGELRQASMRFRESFKRVPANRIGDAQGDILREAAEMAFAGTHPVKLRGVYERLREVYATKRKKDDVVTATFKDMMSWDLFEPAMSPSEFFGQSWIIDLHKAPETVKRLVCFLLFDSAYTYLSQCPDAALDDQNNRALRLVVAVDEARLVLGYEQQSLIGMVRESRSKGGVMMFISQSPDDFDQKTENFFENIGLTACFRTAARSGALNALLGQVVDLNSLKDGVCVTRLVDRGVIQVKAWDFAK
jgi:DNA sulfur modification protein DndE